MRNIYRRGARLKRDKGPWACRITRYFRFKSIERACPVSRNRRLRKGLAKLWLDSRQAIYAIWLTDIHTSGQKSYQQKKKERMQMPNHACNAISATTQQIEAMIQPVYQTRTHFDRFGIWTPKRWTPHSTDLHRPFNPNDHVTGGQNLPPTLTKTTHTKKKK